MFFAACADGKTPLDPNPPSIDKPPVVAGNPFEGSRLYVDRESNAAKQVLAWRNTRPADAALIAKIADQPQAFWLGDWHDVAFMKQYATNAVNAAAAAGATPVLVLYNIPQRDCGMYSAGGAGSADAYRAWIQIVADVINGRKVVVILEPDGIADSDCLNATDLERRFSLIREAVSALAARGALVYIDAGHAGWNSPEEQAKQLLRAGIANAQGFALNVSNFVPNAPNATYGAAISRLVGGKHFVIDTSRNGAGPGSTWCNPDGRVLGVAPTTRTNDPLIDAFLWIKRPGESDGTCNGGPGAGQWWADYALAMARRS